MSQKWGNIDSKPPEISLKRRFECSCTGFWAAFSVFLTFFNRLNARSDKRFQTSTDMKSLIARISQNCVSSIIILAVPFVLGQLTSLWKHEFHSMYLQSKVDAKLCSFTIDFTETLFCTRQCPQSTVQRQTLFSDGCYTIILQHEYWYVNFFSDFRLFDALTFLWANVRWNGGWHSRKWVGRGFFGDPTRRLIQRNKCSAKINFTCRKDTKTRRKA